MRSIAKADEEREDLRRRIEEAEEAEEEQENEERKHNNLVGELEKDIDGRPREEANHKIKRETPRECTEEEHKRYRSVIMKLNYLAVDRPDIQWAVRRCAKNMSSPNEEDQERLKRVGRDLKGRPRTKAMMKFKGKKHCMSKRICASRGVNQDNRPWRWLFDRRSQNGGPEV